jgi:hypothetical protein
MTRAPESDRRRGLTEADVAASPDLELLEQRLEEMLGRGTRLQPTPSWLRLGAEDRPAPLDRDEADRLRKLLARLRSGHSD